MAGFFEAIAQGRKGLVFGNSLYLPFQLDLLTIWVGKEMSMISSPQVIVDLCPGSGDVAIREEGNWTNIVLRGHGDLVRELGNGKGHVILYAVEKGRDPFVQEHRHYVRVSFTMHTKEISLEIIDDPLQL